MKAESAIASSPWHAGWLSPLNLAAYITWMATLPPSIDFAALAGGSVTEIVGLLLLLGMLGGYMLAQSPLAQAAEWRSRALVLLQAACTLGASALLREGSTTILLIIVAAQVVSMWPRRQALVLMVAINATLVAFWSQHYSVMQIFVYLLPMIGFQAFAGLTMHYAMSAEQAHDRLADTHAELLATQRLLEDAARTGERLRLSRELHDVAGHKLTALRLNLRLLAREPAFAAREELATCETLSEELLSDIRAVVSELRRHDGLDLQAAIEKLARPIPGTRFELDVDPALRVQRVETAEILLRCAQEGITNALRHGRARHIALQCRQQGDAIALTIRNDGASPRALEFGNGLTGMRERLREVGGDLALRALPDGGAELTATLPAAA